MIGGDPNNVNIVVTGLAWMGHGVGSVESAIERMLTDASNEIQVATYMVTQGADEFLQLIRDCLSRGIQVTLILNRFSEQPERIRNRIEQMAQTFGHFFTFDFNPRKKRGDLHAKIIVVDRSIALVGSPNLSWGGLVTNHELAFLVEGPAASTVARLLDILVKDSRTRAVKTHAERKV